MYQNMNLGLDLGADFEHRTALVRSPKNTLDAS